MINICSATKLISDKQLFLKVLNSGYTHLRINFSHINNLDADTILKVARENSKEIKIIQDLQGPKIRIGEISETYMTDVYKLDQYKMFMLYKDGENIKNTRKIPAIPICFEDYNLLNGTKKFVLSNKRFKSNISVLETEEYDWGMAFVCMADSECVFRAEKGLNAIGFDRTRITLSEKDKQDVLWALENKADIVILSFVATAKQVKELKTYIKKNSEYMPQIWAKIECLDGIQNACSIIKECDGIMIGRGDMCVEIPLLDIPKAQDYLIRLCKQEKKECVVATHLFDNYDGFPNLSDVTVISHLKDIGATGFMMSNEVIFAKNPVKISKDFYNIIK